MSRTSTFDNGKGQSLVFTFGESLPDGLDLNAPEPDFSKWIEKALFVDIAISGDEAVDDKLPEQERNAWRLYCNALEATDKLLELYRSDLPLFQKLARQM